MKIRFRLLGAVLIIALLSAALYYSKSGMGLHEERTIFGSNDKTTIRLWYTDDALTDYLWPVVREIIKTAIENEQNLIIE